MFRIFLLFSCIWISAFSKISEKVLICGVCRDVEEKLPYTMQIMEKIGNLFSDYRILVYENNSIDKTSSILKNWEKTNTKVFVKSEKISPKFEKQLFVNSLEGNKFYRPEMIARARNVILKHVFSQKYDGFDYVIWMDMDFKYFPSFDGIKEVFLSQRKWDAVLAYGIDPPGTYWDWYAFRDQNYPLGSELLGNDWWYMPKEFLLTPKDDWHPVYSAFGGCGIYKKDSIKGCQYSAIVTQDLEEVAKSIIHKGKETSHPQIMKYLQMTKDVSNIIRIPYPQTNLPKIIDPNIGIILFENTNPLIWKMSSFVYQYPSVCEHVTFHASMIKNGHGNIFINPRLIFRYGG